MNNTSTPSGPEIAFTLENIDYSVKVSIESEKIMLSAKPVDPEIPFYYQYESNFEELSKINEIFSVLKSKEERKKFLIDISSKKENISLIESNINDDGEEHIIIDIKYNIVQIVKSIRFNLCRIITDDKKMNKYLTKLLNFYKPKNSLLPFDSKLITHIS